MTDMLVNPFPLAPLSKDESLRRGGPLRRAWLYLRGYRWREILVIEKAHFAYATAFSGGYSAEVVADETRTEHQWVRSR